MPLNENPSENAHSGGDTIFHDNVDIVMTSAMWRALRLHLLPPSTKPSSPPNEQLAFLLASANLSKRRQRLLVREMLPTKPEDLLHQGQSGIAPRPEFVLQVLNRCRNESLHLIEVHSHPFSHGPGTTFSGLDWTNDRGKMPSISTLLEDFIHATMVIGQDSLDAHFYDRASGQILPIKQLVVVGIGDASTSSGLRYIPTTSARGQLPVEEADTNSRYHRQELIFGHEIQQQLGNISIVVTGLGGLGSFVALELAHLGVGHLIMIDPDCVEESNLNRLLGAEPADIGQTKVSVYERIIRRLAPATSIEAIPNSIMDEAALTLAKGADILVGCVDNHGARLILNQLAIRYLIPLVDGGSGIKQASNRTLLSAGGQAQVVLPGIGCLECRGFINMRRATFDLAPPELKTEERAHGYGLYEPVPTVIFLNGVIGSTMVAEIVFLLTGRDVKLPKPVPPISLYSAFDRSLIAMESHESPDCPTCGSEGVLGLGDLAPVHSAAFASRASSIAGDIPQNLSITTEEN